MHVSNQPPAAVLPHHDGSYWVSQIVGLEVGARDALDLRLPLSPHKGHDAAGAASATYYQGCIWGALRVQ